ncbi:hypothetical protein BK010_09140 [Tenericutes bacterium MO-XQ]|nr:hypothetical protein BK010_09140 [Tenericutes bacterium MO-XQ]
MDLISWMRNHDISLNYLVKRDFLGVDDLHLKNQILSEGYGLRLMNLQDQKTHLWGEGVYSPKYTSTHYTLLELCQLGAHLDEKRIHKSISILFDVMWKEKGLMRRSRHQDMCVVAMMVRIAATAHFKDNRIFDMIDYILEYPMSDGGWNCSWERKPKPKQSSLHTTLSVLEAFHAYIENGYTYKIDEIHLMIPKGVSYILSKRLFRAVRTNEIIHKDMLSFPFPYGWKYDVLRALTAFANLDIPYDEKMEEGLNMLMNRLDEFGRVKADPKALGLHHFRYTKTNQPCPFNTYRILNVLKKYKLQIYNKYSLGDN